MSTFSMAFVPILFTLPILLLMLLFAPQIEPAVQVSQPVNPVSIAVEAASPFYAKTQDNRMVIFQEGHAAPILVTEIDVRTLPVADQQALAEGIGLADQIAVERLLEDYGS